MGIEQGVVGESGQRTRRLFFCCNSIQLPDFRAMASRRVWPVVCSVHASVQPLGKFSTPNVPVHFVSLIAQIIYGFLSQAQRLRAGERT